MYNYTWDKHAEGDYSQFGENKIPARIPISALVSGAPFASYFLLWHSSTDLGQDPLPATSIL